jgi:hypothetical protein
VEEADIVVHEADEPDPIIDFLDAEALIAGGALQMCRRCVGSPSRILAQKRLTRLDWMRRAVTRKLVQVRAHGLAARLSSKAENVIRRWQVGN